MPQGKRTSDILPATLGIKCRHRTKTRRCWNLCPKCYTKYLRVVAPEVLEKRKQFYAARWAKYAAQERERLRENCRRRPIQVKRDKHLRRSYGITVYQFNEMARNQDYYCKICLRSPGKRLNCDHDHTTGRVRGLLCYWCNRGLPYFRNDPAILRRAAEYLESEFDGRKVEPARSIIGKVVAKAVKTGQPVEVNGTNGKKLIFLSEDTFARMFPAKPEAST
jgi:hypothetical protein